MAKSTGTTKSPARIRQGKRAGGAPGVNWSLGATLAADGDSDAAIARILGVSEEAVRKRRHAEGWHTPRTASDDPDSSTDPGTPAPDDHPDQPTSIRALAAAVCSQALGSANPFSEDQLTLVLTNLAAGTNLHLAAKAAGTTVDALQAAAADDPQLASTLSIAAARAVTSKIMRINAAGQRGDWKADAYILERHPDSKADFNPTPTPAGKGGVTVILNFDRDALKPDAGVPGPATAQIIDGEATEL